MAKRNPRRGRQSTSSSGSRSKDSQPRRPADQAPKDRPREDRRDRSDDDLTDFDRELADLDFDDIDDLDDLDDLYGLSGSDESDDRKTPRRQASPESAAASESDSESGARRKRRRRRKPRSDRGTKPSGAETSSADLESESESETKKPSDRDARPRATERSTASGKSGTGEKTRGGEKTRAGDRARSGEKSAAGERSRGGEKTHAGEKARSGEKSHSGEKARSGEKSRSGDKSHSVEKARSGEKSRSGDKSHSVEKARSSEKSHSGEKSGHGGRPDRKHREAVVDETVSDVEVVETARVELPEFEGDDAEWGFDQFEISPHLKKAVRAAGYRQPTPVQSGVIPRALEGVNVIGQARTGTGKTAAFMIPIIERTPAGKDAPPQALVLVPTRELAEQVEGEFTKLAAGSRLRSAVLVGGKPMKRQLTQLEHHAEVVVGTPGRVIDHIRRGSLKLDGVRIVVLDEADRMLDIGFRPDIEKILRRCPKERQTLLLSATVSPEVLKLAERYMVDPVHLNFSPSRVSVDSVVQKYFTVSDDQKMKLLIHLLKRDQPAQAIIFCRTKRGADKVHRQLKKIFQDEIGVMHGDLQQSERTRVLQQLRDDQLRFLVATDVVGRGIDVSGISHIFNFDIPFTSDDYVHRVGRTGRMGRQGTAYTFVTLEEGDKLTAIEMLINRLLERDHWDGEEGPTGEPSRGDAPAEKPAKEVRQTSGLLSRSGRGPKKYRRGL